ncbi:MAG TPA: VTT domain-containing protein [Bryobacteraceae bacterium]|nr:VTT domain-containing protein [Bryobacteraceae bacterium]
MRTVIGHLFQFFLRLGGFGLLGMGILDSSFLFMPLGNDLLVVALTTRHHSHMPYYAAMAAAGSVLGCLVVDLVCRRIGEEKLERMVSKKRLEYVHHKMEKRAGIVLAFAALMPPPFPFTAFLMGASALEYPRPKLLSVIAASRLCRFLIIGGLAIVFGSQIIRVSKTPAFEWTIGFFVLLCLVGSGFSLVKWFRTARGTGAPAAVK